MTEFSYGGAMLLYEQQILAGLAAKLQAYEPGQYSVSLKDKNSMWKVSSAIQKSVRRGWWKQAEKYVTAMINGGQAGYLWYRLPVIALEDIGLGDMQLCGEVLAASRLAANRKDFDQPKLLKYLIVELAKARKSRALCDMTCYVNASTSKVKKLNCFIRDASVDGLLTLLGDYQGDGVDMLAEKTLIVRYLLGDRKYDEENELEPAPIEPGKSALLGWVVGSHGASPMPGDYLFWASTKVKAHQLHESIPLLFNPIEPQTEKVTDFGEPTLVGGVPDVSFDWHVSDGKRCITYFGKACKPVQAWLEGRGLNTLSAVGMALFQEESAALDRLLCSPTLDELLKVNDRLELDSVGFAGDSGYEFRELLRREDVKADLLKVRRRVIEGTKFD